MATASPPLDQKSLELIRAFPLRPIRDDVALDRAIPVVKALAPRDDLTDVEEDYLDVLSTLVHQYESARYPEPETSPALLLRDLLDGARLSPDRLSAETGIAASTLAGILAGNRRIGPRVRKALAERFKVAGSAFR